MARVEKSALDSFPVAYRDRVVIEDDDGSWVLNTEMKLGGAPTSILEWWGLSALRRRSASIEWPVAKRVLCVDTFPNASRLATEVIESIRALIDIRNVDAMIVTSPEMGEGLDSRLPRLRNSVPSFVVESPFAARSHASTRLSAEPHKRQRLIFTGRSDYFCSRHRSMAKDDMARSLTNYIDAGADVYIQQPHDANLAHVLESRGFLFYPYLDRAAITDGRYAEMIAKFDAHLALYNVVNGTLKRRVGQGLSTRYATALCSSAPIVVPRDARFARRFFEQTPIGTHERRSVSETLAVLRDSQIDFRATWDRLHLNWAAEGRVETLLRALS